MPRTALIHSLVTLVVFALLGAYIAPERTLAIKGLAILLAGIGLFVALYNLLRSPRSFHWTLMAACGLSAAVALLSLVVTDWRAGALIKSFNPGGANPHMVGGAMAVLLPLPLCLVILGRGRWLRLAGLAAALLALVPLLLSQAPQAWLGAAIGLVVVASGRMRGGKRWLPALGLVLLLGLVWTAWQYWIPAALADRLDLGVEARLTVWPVAVRMALDMPFTGVGLNNFPVIYDLEKVTPYVAADAHNLFLQTVLDLGVFGLLAMVGLFGLGFRAGWRAYRASDDPNLRAAVLGAAGGCAAFLGYGVWDSMTIGNVPALAVWALLGLLAAAERLTCPSRPAKAPTVPIRRDLRVWGWVALAALALFTLPLWKSALDVNLGEITIHRLLVDKAPPDLSMVKQAAERANEALTINPHNSRAYSLAGVAALLSGDVTQAMESFEETLRLDPTDRKTHERLADLYLRQKCYIEALAECQRMAAVKPGSEWEWWGEHCIATVYAAQGDWPAAVQEYQAATELSVRLGTAPETVAQNYISLGDAWLKAGDPEQARSAYNTALVYDPDNTTALTKLEALAPK